MKKKSRGIVGKKRYLKRLFYREKNIYNESVGTRIDGYIARVADGRNHKDLFGRFSASYRQWPPLGNGEDFPEAGFVVAEVYRVKREKSYSLFGIPETADSSLLYGKKSLPNKPHLSFIYNFCAFSFVISG